MKIKTHLISGAGNTFHIVFDQALANEVGDLKEVARQVCVATPADGLIFLKKAGESYSWDFFNRDGSEAEMCGNASRCVGYYIYKILKDTKQSWLLSTVAGSIAIRFIKEEQYEIKMTSAKQLQSEQGFFCDTGVPHLVLSYKSGNLFAELSQELKSEASKLRHHAEFFPKGTNVTYVEFATLANKVRAITYERGVEDFTRACGTGAVAAAFYNLAKRGISETQVEMPGGTLIINLSDLNAPIMQGPAKLLGSYDHEITI